MTCLAQRYVLLHIYSKQPHAQHWQQCRGADAGCDCDSVVEEHGGVQCHSSQTCIARDIIKVMMWDNKAVEQMRVVIQASVVKVHDGLRCHSSQTCIAKDIIKVMT